MAKVKVYSTSTCPWCHKTKEFLREHSVPFDDINVEENQKAAQDMVERSGQMGVPVIDIAGEIVVGFDKSRIEKALKKNGLLKAA